MCGIVGAVSSQNVIPTLLEGLTRLEYRGYDSAGLVVIDDHQSFLRHRNVGKVKVLKQSVREQPIEGSIGIAHTRWATHGKPSEQNAHPHIADNDIALVHNGIIENHEKLREFVTKQGCILTSETDSELVAHLIAVQLKTIPDLLSAVRTVMNQLEGTFAIAVLNRHEPDKLIAFRKGSPLVIGLGSHENFIASDQLALLSVAQQFIYLEEGDVAEITREHVLIYDEKGTLVKRQIHTSQLNYQMINKGLYRHFMLKEIFDQPESVLATIEGRITAKTVLVEAFGIKAAEIFEKVKRVEITACGTSYHAALVAKFWIEEIAHLPCQVEIASENRYRAKIIEPDTLFVTLSQSGETADTLGALRLAKKSGYLATLTICNVPESSLVRESDLGFITGAGPEIGVASTKAFTTQLAALFMLALALSRDHAKEAHYVKLLAAIPHIIKRCLTLNTNIKMIATLLTHKHHVIFLGRGIVYPIAMEGALKLKEISYIHAEAYPAGELKHGPLALIDHHMSVIALAPKDDVLVDKLKSNLHEVLARGGKLILFADKKVGIEENATVTYLPAVDRLLAPIVYTIPLQLLAYYVAVEKGTDIDQPRNLAKSVTVE